MKHPYVVMLGTGSAMPVRSYNTCFAVCCPDGATWLVDAGGGNGIFAALDRAGIAPDAVDCLFVSHVHTDHIFGAVWLIRALIGRRIDGRYDRRLRLYGNRDVIHALTEICRLTFLESYFRRLREVVDMIEVAAGDTVEDQGGIMVEFFDAGSVNVAQTAMKMRFSPDGPVLAILGDEALTERNIDCVRGVDWLMCGAFCRYADRERFRPYEKHHHTVRDVARLAEVAAVKNLVLYHSEDATPCKRELYTAEAARYFSGNIFVPADGDIITL